MPRSSTVKKKVARVFNIGYQGRSLSAFCEALSEAGVEILVDVRAAAWSQRPQFRKTALGAALRDHGIGYVHCKVAGNPFRPKAGAPLDLRKCAAAYSAHLRTNPGIVEAVAKVIAQKSSALLCYEAKRRDCHRGLLLKALVKRSPRLTVVDL